MELLADEEAKPEQVDSLASIILAAIKNTLDQIPVDNVEQRTKIVAAAVTEHLDLLSCSEANARIVHECMVFYEDVLATASFEAAEVGIEEPANPREIPTPCFGMMPLSA